MEWIDINKVPPCHPKYLPVWRSEPVLLSARLQRPDDAVPADLLTGLFVGFYEYDDLDDPQDSGHWRIHLSISEAIPLTSTSCATLSGYTLELKHWMEIPQSPDDLLGDYR